MVRSTKFEWTSVNDKLNELAALVKRRRSITKRFLRLEINKSVLLVFKGYFDSGSKDAFPIKLYHTEVHLKMKLAGD